MIAGIPPDILKQLNTPHKFQKFFWPGVKMYPKQWDMVYGVRDSAETFVVAGNKLGKDFVSGFICLSFFVHPAMYFEPEYVAQVEARRTPGGADPHTVRIVNTSVTDKHLNVLWGEIGRFAKTAKYNLLKNSMTMIHHEVRFKAESESRNPVNYLRGLVWSAGGEGLAGHHAAYTLGVGDESTGLGDEVHIQFQGWAKRKLYFGNPNPVEQLHFFRSGFESGDLNAGSVYLLNTDGPIT